MTPRDPNDLLIHLDGKLLPTREATVSVFDHSFLYGDGIFETYRVADGLVFRMEPHLDRLERSARAIALDLPGSRDDIRRIILETVAANGLADCYVKSIITRGAGAEPLLEHTGIASKLVVIVRPSMPFFTPGAGNRGLSAAIVSVRKTPMAAVDPRIKSNNYLNVILSRIEARGMGAQESILLDDRGRVVEASFYNIVAVRGRRLLTPHEGCLEGITLETALDIAGPLGYEIRRGPVYPYDLMTADEVLFTSTAGGVIPVTVIDGRAIGAGSPGPVWAELSAGYERALRDPAQGVAVPGLREALAGS
jgi:branched-chain amino acid aminotransferase